VALHAISLDARLYEQDQLRSGAEQGNAGEGSQSTGRLAAGNQFGAIVDRLLVGA
jgi:hypothetical protein